MINNTEIKNLRRNYSLKVLDESTVNENPYEQFSVWMQEAINSNILDASAMILATANSKGLPSVRVVLLKGIEEEGFIFYTNYTSHKANDIESNPTASILFFWKELERQVRITGKVEKISKEQSEEYFHSRPYDSQLGAIASKQSSVIPNREFLEKKFQEEKEKYKGSDIPLPEYWGGYKVTPDYFEFWQGRESRLHDRICYERKGSGWRISRLSP